TPTIHVPDSIVTAIPSAATATAQDRQQGKGVDALLDLRPGGSLCCTRSGSRVDPRDKSRRHEERGGVDGEERAQRHEDEEARGQGPAADVDRVGTGADQRVRL